MKKTIPLAIAYDFDGTLAPGNMQERAFIPDIGMATHEFWQECGVLAQKHEADNILVYMRLMLEKAERAGVPVRRENFVTYGAGLEFFKGVLREDKEDGWFDRINKYAARKNVKVEHYVISSGIREMIQGTPIANKFSAIFASSFWYDHNDVPKWPALALNYTTKTQYIFRINKGVPHVYEHNRLNEFLPDHERPVPFANMMFIGDGETDVPCFRLVKEQGGHSVAVYEPRNIKARERSQGLIDVGRVNFMAQADYREDHDLDKIVKGVIDKIAADHHLTALKKD